LEEAKANHKIERFFWILTVTILTDCTLFKLMDSGFPDLFIALLSLILIIGCAQWLEVPYVGVYLDRVFTRFLSVKSHPQKPEDPEES